MMEAKRKRARSSTNNMRPSRFFRTICIILMAFSIVAILVTLCLSGSYNEQNFYTSIKNKNIIMYGFPNGFGNSPPQSFAIENEVEREVELAEEKHSLITLFTTVPPETSKVGSIQRTLKNWQQFKQQADILVFASNLSYSIPPNITLLHPPEINKFGLPVLKNMFLGAENFFQSSRFFGYSNADILFDKSLMTTLESLDELLSFHNIPEVMIMGRRMDLNLTYIQEGYDDGSERLVDLVERYGRIHSDYGMDYFITIKQGYPWNTFPSLVVGRIYYDNWIVHFSNQHNILLIDVTQTVLAVHQTDEHGNREGHAHSKPGHNYNRDLLRKRCSARKYGCNAGHAPVYSKIENAEFVLKCREAVLKKLIRGNKEHIEKLCNAKLPLPPPPSP